MYLDWDHDTRLQKLKETLTEVFDSYINHAEKLASLGST